ncbi:MAG: MBL fold metallo-hydrolase [Gammaproteobacteria bacterium]|nr:MBL fold metallo-hydrolase [Gammaproteobacteria bacterium]
MLTWQIGDVRVTRIVELEIGGVARFILPDATREACQPMRWMMPHFATDTGELIMSVHALIVESEGQQIVIDTCIGNDKQNRILPGWNGLQTSFLKDFEGAGFSRESIDTVLCTHLHIDHVGWNTMLVDGEWVPTFPNADYLMATKEWDHWRTEDDVHTQAILADSVKPIFDAGLARLVDTDHRITGEVCLQPTHGHTPGHVSVHINSRGQEAMITGDSLHHPCQIEHPEWCSPADSDSGQARATRESLIEHWHEGQTLVIGTHFAAPTAGRVQRFEDGGYWLDIEQ